ncbi:MAG: hypothetical protein LBH09_08280 [Peptococcaceae bacterium]|nr:hypothetical protein [Peptococcaceae bacterium]
MNSKSYLPIACILFCMAYILVVDAPVMNKLILTIAALVFVFLLISTWGKGDKK